MNKTIALLCCSLSFLCLQPISVRAESTEDGASPNAKETVKPIGFDHYKHTVMAVDYKKHTVRLSELERLSLRPDVYILDLRSPSEFKEGHIKGAHSFGCDINEEKLKKLVPNKDARIVIYCTNNFFPTRMLSLNSVSLPQFLALGYKNTGVLEELWHSDFKAVDKFKQGPLWVSPTTSGQVPAGATTH